MIRRPVTTPPRDPSDKTRDLDPADAASGLPPNGSAGPDLAALPIAGITQRRMAILLGALVTAWIILLFARQVSDASAASSRAETMVAENSLRHAEIAALERELERIQQRRFILQQARAHGLGGHNEIAFTLDPDAPSLAPDAPGSAAQRVGAPSPVSPLESWLTILFGSGD